VNAAEIAAKLGESTNAGGGNWRCRCPICGKPNLSLKDGKGRVRLLIKCWSGCESKAVRAELKARKLLNGSAGNGAAALESEDEQLAREAAEAAERQAKIDNALDMFRQSLPAERAGLVEIYLNSRLLMHRPVPASVRFLPGVRHPKERQRYPAAVCLVEHQKEGATGIHCILLNPLDASSKLTIEDRKLSFGAIKGGSVRLFPLTGAELAIGEGVEDCLAFQQSTGIPAWATLGHTGLVDFEPPPLPRDIRPTLILIEDQDENGRRSVAKAAERFMQRGFKVRVARPIAGKVVSESLLNIGLVDPICTIEDYVEVPSGDWYTRCQTNAKDIVLSNLSNTALALRSDPAFEGMLRYDSFADVAIMHRPAPKTANQTKFTDPDPRYPRPLTDNDISRTQEWLQLAGIVKVSATTVYQAVKTIAQESSFHPVRDYLDTRTWDEKTNHVDNWLTECLGVEKNEYTTAVGRMFIISMVARIYQPGCQCDYMLILEGPQGEEKSKALRILAGEWFSDNLPSNVASKDAKQHLCGKWLIEIPDLHIFRKSEIRALKAFQTMREDVFRPPYDKTEIYRKRQNVFAATTNEQTYLEDPTGGRRYWPIVTTAINVAKLIEIRDSLFAEAVARYRKREHWWPDRAFEKQYMAPEQETRRNTDVWEDPIKDHIAKTDLKQATVFQIARDAVGMYTREMGTADQHRITNVLTSLGWTRGKRGTGGTRWWYNPGYTPDLDAPSPPPPEPEPPKSDFSRR
jgi:hypothetical protein